MKKQLLLIVFIGFTASAALAQPSDIRLWAGIQLEKKIIKNLSVHLNGQARFIENGSDLGSYIGELGLSYKLNKHWEVAGYYRYIAKRDWKPKREVYETEQRNRFYADLMYDHKLGKLKFENRLRYQNQFTDVTKEQANRDYLRNKVELSYPNKSRFTPGISADVFYGFGLGFDVIRYRAGVDVKINKRHSISIFGFTEQELVETPQSDLTLGATYKIKL